MSTAKPTKFSLQKALPFILTIGGIFGFLASFVITVEKIELLKNPAFQLSCNLNPIISCGSVMSTKQASVFGFANSLLGIAAFAVLITIGVALLAGAKFKRWFWLGLEFGTILGLIFVHWLFFQSVFRIGALCPYCMVVWVVTITTFWYTTLYNLREKNIPTPKSLSKVVGFLDRNNVSVLLVWFLVIIGFIANHFWYFWKTVI